MKKSRQNFSRWFINRLAPDHHGVLFYAETDQPLVALTIDDAPDATTTAAILDVLHAFEARATFFLISDYVSGNETLVRRIVTEQHEIGNHLVADYPSILLSDADFERHLANADRILRPYGELRWFRPANGFYKRAMLKTAHYYGYTCVLGDVLPLDILPASPALISRSFLSAIRPGSMLTLHDGRWRGRRTAETLRRLLTDLRQRGYQTVTVGELYRQVAQN
jgi:peptidoglycan/xylan/chitin deacetylase (PgdA/CDA1 family)